MRTGSSASSFIAFVALTMTSVAHAQTPEAEALFREGKRLLKEGEVTKACEKFEASERLEPENGTELNLADCWERDGRTASAWAMFVKAAASAKREDRSLEARRRADALEPKLVYLTIEVPEAVDLEELEIKRNEAVVDRGLWNTRVPVDPGEYSITAVAPERKEWSTTIKVKSKDKTVVVPELERGARKTKKKKIKDEAAVEEPERPNKYRKETLVLGLSGAGAIVLASGFAIHSKALADEADSVCPDTRCANQGAVDYNHRARTEGWIANIGWGLGGAALVGALVVWYMGTSGEDSVAVTPAVSDDGAGVTIGGRF